MHRGGRGKKETRSWRSGVVDVNVESRVGGRAKVVGRELMIRRSTGSRKKLGAVPTGCRCEGGDG